MKNKNGLTISIIFEAASANYGEGLGNVTALKKLTRGDGEAYTYISRQAIRYNIVQQMGADKTKLALDGSVIQFAPEATIDDYAEIDLFGYMKTLKGEQSKTRSAIVRLSNAVSLESYAADLDFLTNKGLLDRYNKDNKLNDSKKGGNIAQSEIHKSFYAYTITIDLDQVGIDKNDDIEIPNSDKSERVCLLLDTVKLLYRDIKGRREDLKPVFVIGGLYEHKNPFFENKLKVTNKCLQLDTIVDVLNVDERIKENTGVGLISGIFDNDAEIKETLKAVDMGTFFSKLTDGVKEYYKD